FFFQAEDGIRSFHVTGVQTCALPILIHFLGASPWPDAPVRAYAARHAVDAMIVTSLSAGLSVAARARSWAACAPARVCARQRGLDRKSAAEGRGVEEDLPGRRPARQQ